MRIAVSQTITYINDTAHDTICHGWYKILRGHNIFFVPNTTEQDLDLVANNSDSFIITDGIKYPLKRTIEFKLASKMIQLGKPVVGIGEGAFLVNEILEGTVEEIKNHNNTIHPIFYHREVLEVTSNHTHGIVKVADNTNILCRDYLGYVEAFIDGNLAGVVWNPELMEKPWIPPEIALMLRI